MNDAEIEAHFEHNVDVAWNHFLNRSAAMIDFEAPWALPKDDPAWLRQAAFRRLLAWSYYVLPPEVPGGE